MKFIHLGDLHLGKSLGEYDLIDDQKYLLDQILNIIDENNINSAILAGDIYDRAIPSVDAVELFDYFINELVNRNIYTYIISGNHDSDERLNYGSTLFKTHHIYISSKFNGKLDKYAFNDENGKVNIYLLPFIKASQVKYYYPDEEINNYDDAIKCILNNEKINYSERNIIVSHQFVTGKNNETMLSGSESLAVKSVGTIEKISYDCFKDFDYVALGHIHSPQKVGLDYIRYAGSLMKYSLSEVLKDKSVPIITINKKNDLNIELKKLLPKRDLRHIKGELNTLLDKNNVTNVNDFIYVTLTDEDIINDAIGIMRQTYPYIVKLDYDNSHTKDVDEINTPINEDISFKELFSNFYMQIYGSEISEEEEKIIMDVAKKVGVINEAD